MGKAQTYSKDVIDGGVIQYKVNAKGQNEVISGPKGISVNTLKNIAISDGILTNSTDNSVTDSLYSGATSNGSKIGYTYDTKTNELNLSKENMDIW